jgi:hypothetical protein
MGAKLGVWFGISPNKALGAELATVPPVELGKSWKSPVPRW